MGAWDSNFGLLVNTPKKFTQLDAHIQTQPKPSPLITSLS